MVRNLVYRGWIKKTLKSLRISSFREPVKYIVEIVRMTLT